jgi:hypothetical protein
VEFNRERLRNIGKRGSQRKWTTAGAGGFQYVYITKTNNI